MPPAFIFHFQEKPRQAKRRKLTPKGEDSDSDDTHETVQRKAISEKILCDQNRLSVLAQENFLTVEKCNDPGKLMTIRS